MEARTIRLAILATALMSLGASHRTENFIVSAPTPRLAERIGVAAEKYRRELAVEWLGHELRPWGRPCPISANVAPNLGAGGATSFVFQHGEVYGWEMSIQGSELRILDSVLPHEVTHTIFATHFRQPLPRWADEGACTTVEHPSEKQRHQQLLIQFLKTGRGIAMSRLFRMKEYPQDVLPLYAQGFSVARFMIQQGGKRKFVAFMEDGLDSGDWTAATRTHYGYGDLAKLQSTWLDWVRNGSPQQTPLDGPPNSAIADNGRGTPATPATFAPEKNGTNPAAVNSIAAQPAAANLSATDAPPFNPTASARPSAAGTASTDRDPSRLAGASAPGTPPPASATRGLPVNWQGVPAKSADNTTSAATGGAPPHRYQAVRQQPPQRPRQRVLR